MFDWLKNKFITGSRFKNLAEWRIKYQDSVLAVLILLLIPVPGAP